MTALWQSFETALAAGGVAAVPLALLGGILTGLNPCCLAFYPAVAGTCCATAGRSAAPGLAAFLAGTAIATTFAGVAAALAGHAVVAFGRGPRYALAFIPIVMGLHLVRWMRLPLPPAPRPFSAFGMAGAFLAGALLSLVVGVCGTPVFAAVLSYAAYTGSIVFGAVLLFAYGIGSGLPMLVAGAGAIELARRSTSEVWQHRLDRVSGALLLAVGFYLLTRA